MITSRFPIQVLGSAFGCLLLLGTSCTDQSLSEISAEQEVTDEQSLSIRCVVPDLKAKPYFAFQLDINEKGIETPMLANGEFGDDSRELRVKATKYDSYDAVKLESLEAEEVTGCTPDKFGVSGINVFEDEDPANGTTLTFECENDGDGGTAAILLFPSFGVGKGHITFPAEATFASQFDFQIDDKQRFDLICKID